MNDQAVIIALGIIATLIGALAAYIKSSGEARIKALEIELEKVKGTNEKITSDEHQETSLFDVLGRAIDRFDHFTGDIKGIERAIENAGDNVSESYTSLRTFFEHGIQSITQNSVTQREALEKSRHQEFLAFANEFATQFVAQQKARTIDRNLFVYPSPAHPGWKYRYAMPVYNKVTFFNAPWMDDTTPIDGVEIDSEGELVHVIENYVNGWHVVAKTKNGINFPGIGYVPVHAVKLTEVTGSED